MKLNECSCLEEFTGPLCEQKKHASELLFIRDRKAWVFDKNGYEVNKNFQISNNLRINRSCSTVIYGEASKIKSPNNSQSGQF